MLVTVLIPEGFAPVKLTAAVVLGSFSVKCIDITLIGQERLHPLAWHASITALCLSSSNVKLSLIFSRGQDCQWVSQREMPRVGLILVPPSWAASLFVFCDIDWHRHNDRLGGKVAIEQEAVLYLRTVTLVGRSPAVHPITAKTFSRISPRLVLVEVCVRASYSSSFGHKSVYTITLRGSKLQRLQRILTTSMLIQLQATVPKICPVTAFYTSRLLTGQD